MLVPVTESVISLSLIAMVIGFYTRRRHLVPRHRGFDLLLVGLVLVCAGSLIDLFEPQAREVLPPAAAAVLEVVKLVGGYVLGMVLAGAGVWTWIPALARYQSAMGDKRRAEARLVESAHAMRRRAESLGVLHQLSAELQGVVAVETIAQRALDTLVRLSSPPLAGVFLTRPGGDSLRLVAQTGFLDGALDGWSELSVHDSYCGEVMHSGEPLLVADIGELRAPGLAALLRSYDVHAALFVPLHDGDQACGSICIMCADPALFTPLETDTFGAFANTVSLALTNARQLSLLDHQAHHDSLTGLPNRAMLHRSFEALVGRSRPDAPLTALSLIDLDRFKEVNDTLGHHVGDRMLSAIGARLVEAAGGQSGLVARLGGDEYAVVSTGLADVAAAAALAGHLHGALTEPVSVDGMTLDVGASVGVALHPLHGMGSHDLLRCADVAMYKAKRDGTGKSVYDPGHDHHTPERLAMMTELGTAIRAHQLRLAFQPKIDLRTRLTVGVEALVRWEHPQLGLLQPEEFIVIAEMTEHIESLTLWVVRQALTRAAGLARDGFALDVAVNMSARLLSDASLAAKLEATLAAVDGDARRLELEITETSLMQDPERALRTVELIRALGIRVAIDDFGAGYSSMTYLKQLPVDELKLDRAIVSDLAAEDSSRIIVEATINMAHRLGARVTAEGVEDAATLEALIRLGCDNAQGFHLARPMYGDELAVWCECAPWPASRSARQLA